MAGTRSSETAQKQSSSRKAVMVAIYARVSTEDQANNTSIPLQLEEGREFCEKNGYEHTEYIDNFSGASISRDGWKRLFNDIDNGLIAGIWVKATDRFSRNTKDGLTALEIIRKKGVRFFISQEEQNITTPEFEMLITMQFAFAQFERSKILKRTLDGRIATTNSGGKKTQQTLGYRNAYDENGKRYLVINEKEAELVKYIFSLFIDENLPFKQIAKRLNDEGYKTKNHGKKVIDRQTKKEVILAPSWTAVHIGNILRRPEYAGLVSDWEHTKLMKAKYIPAIIDQKQWEKVQESIGELTPIRNRNGNPRLSQHELSGVMRCEKCNAQYYWRHSTNGHKIDYYYHKYDTEKQRACKNKSKYIQAVKLEQLIMQTCDAVLRDPVRLRVLFDNYKKTLRVGSEKLFQDRERLQERLTEVESKIEALLNAIEDGTIKKERAKERMKAHEDEAEHLQTEIDAISNKLATSDTEYDSAMRIFRMSLKEQWNKGTPVKRREFYYQLFDSIVIQNGVIRCSMYIGGAVIINLKEIGEPTECDLKKISESEFELIARGK